MNLEEALEILESVRDQVTKKYGGMFDKGLSARGLSKHKRAIENDVNELISAAKRNLPDNEKNSTDAIDRESNRIEARRNNTKNKIGAYKTDLHTIGYGGKLRGWSELDKNREEDKKNGYKRAIEKSIRRHNEKVSEALDLMEAIINEVSVGALARAVENNNQKRRDDAAKAIKGYRKSRSEYNKLADKYPEEEPGLYRKMSADDEAAVKVVNKKDHSEDLKKLNLPKDSKVSANKLFKAAHKVEDKREKALDNVKKANDFLKKLNRAERAWNTTFADPVKSRTNEALELMEDIYDAIEKRHGEPKSSIHTGKNRAAELFDKVHAMKKAAKEAKKNVTTAKMSEAISIAEEMLQLANSIFEVAPEAPVSAEEVPPSENKIKQTKKDKENPEKKKEVVSVADELFPYEGNAKQQMNQKILAKINDMIEGTATLEDLLQLVRKGTKKTTPVKESFDRAEAMLEELICEISDKHITGKINKAIKDEEHLEKTVDNVEKMEGMPSQVINDLKTFLSRKKHKNQVNIDKINQRKINKIQNQQDN